MEMTNKENLQKIKSKYKKRSQMADVWMRLKRNKLAMFGLIILTILILTAIFADLIADYNTEVIKINEIGRASCRERV